MSESILPPEQLDIKQTMLDSITNEQLIIHITAPPANSFEELKIQVLTTAPREVFVALLQGLCYVSPDITQILNQSSYHALVQFQQQQTIIQPPSSGIIIP